MGFTLELELSQCYSKVLDCTLFTTEDKRFGNFITI